MNTNSSVSKRTYSPPCIDDLGGLVALTQTVPPNQGMINEDLSGGCQPGDDPCGQKKTG